MPIVDFDESDDEKLVLTLTDGEIVELELADDCVYVFSVGERIGEFHFNCYSLPSGPGEETVARLTHALLEGRNGRFQRQGIGTEAVRFFLQSTGFILELPENDGAKKDDGSHLVGDGPAFVESLRKKLNAGELQRVRRHTERGETNAQDGSSEMDGIVW